MFSCSRTQTKLMCSSIGNVCEIEGRPIRMCRSGDVTCDKGILENVNSLMISESFYYKLKHVEKYHFQYHMAVFEIAILHMNG